MTSGECYDAADRLMKFRQALAVLWQQHGNAIGDIAEAHGDAEKSLDDLHKQITSAQEFYIHNASAPRERGRE